MHCKFHKKILKDIKKLDNSAKLRLSEFLEEAQNSAKLSDLPVKKIQGYKDFWRFRLGNYRIGISLEQETIIFRRILHRKDIYKRFP